MPMSLSSFRGVLLALVSFSSFLAASGQKSTSSGAPSSSTTSGGQYGSLTSPIELGVKNINDEGYTMNIVLGGQNFNVLIDTGSTDLWVYAKGLDIQFTNTTDIQAGIVYGIGQAQGTIVYADLQLGPYTIPNQAFLNATSSDLPHSVDGIIGLAFETFSAIPPALADAWGKEAAMELGAAPTYHEPPRSGPLGRLDENGTDHSGHLLTGQHASGLEAVAKAPKIEQVDHRHWTVAMDGASINGKPFSFNKSSIAGVPAGKVAVALDSGYTTSVLPDAFVDAIYGSIPGAVKYTGAIPGTDNGPGNNWILPCNASTNITFVFGGQEYPIHPRDAVRSYKGIKLDTVDGVDLVANTTVCLNGFFSGEKDDTFDLILGMGFLRNVYTSFNYADYRPGQNNTGQAPYVQLLSTTDRAAAWAEFNAYAAYQLAAGPPAADAASVIALITTYAEATANSTSSAVSSPTSSAGSSSSGSVVATTTAGAAPSASTRASVASNNAASAQELAVAGAVSESSEDYSKDAGGNKYGPVALGLLGANLAIGLVVLGVTVALCMRGGKQKRESRYQPVRLPKEEAAVDVEGAPRYSD